MKISKQWLNDFIECDDLSTAELVETLTTRVAEVDHVSLQAEAITQAKIAYIKELKPHPTKENLKIVQIAIDNAEVEVVCGAPNCQKNIFAVYLPPGATYISKHDKLISVEKKEIAGVISNGALVSEFELGLTADHDSGLMLLEGIENPQPGKSLSSYIGTADTVIEIDNKSLTHRPDLWGHFGFARELSAILKRPLKLDFDRYSDFTEEGEKLFKELGKGKSNYQVTISPETKCRRFCCLEINNVQTNKSPFWLRRRLYAVGANSRNVLVDLSNYVMLDIGQPNHTFDADLITAKKIHVRLAKVGEKLITLDGMEHALDSQDIVVADERQSLALAGIIGGESSAISEKTSRVLLESANFDPVLLRFSTKRQQIRTDASNRFEKNRSPYTPPLAIHRFVQLIKQIQTKASIVGSVEDCFPVRPKKVIIPIRFSYIRERLGENISNEKISEILQSLKFRSLPSKAKDLDQVELEVPYERASRDVTIEDDIVEEVGRIFGYENVSESAPAIVSTAHKSNPLLDLENKIRDLLAGNGFSELYNYSFMSAEVGSRLGYPLNEIIRMHNPIDSTCDCMRTTLVPGLLEVLEKNSRFFKEIAMFEIGRAYQNVKPTFHSLQTPTTKDLTSYEKRLLGLIYKSNQSEENIAQVMTPAMKKGGSFYSLAILAQRIVNLLSKDQVSLSPVRAGTARLSSPKSRPAPTDDYTALRSWMHPYRAAYLLCGELIVGLIAEVGPNSGFDLPERSIIAEIDLQGLLKIKDRDNKFKHIAKFPDCYFEMSIVLPKNTYYQELKEFLVSKVEKNLLKNLEVIAVYQGQPLKEDEKSISVKFSFGAEDKTLSNEELSSIQEKLIKEVNQSKYSLRV